MEKANTVDAVGHLEMLAVLQPDPSILVSCLQTGCHHVPLVMAVHTFLCTELRESRIVMSLYPHVEIIQWPYLRLTKLESGTKIQGFSFAFLTLTIPLQLSWNLKLVLVSKKHCT